MITFTGISTFIALGVSAILATAPAACADEELMRAHQDPITRHIHITYQVPASAPDEVAVLCSWSPAGKGNWRAAKVAPYISETAMRLASDVQLQQWTREGKIIERRAAGLARTVVFNPYPEAEEHGRVDVDFRVQVRKSDGTVLTTVTTHIQAYNSDVVRVEDWSGVVQQRGIEKWSFRTDLGPDSGASFGSALFGKSGDISLPQLTYPLNLKGWYAVYVCTLPGKGRIGIRLSGDERTDTIGSSYEGEEVLWRWAKMDTQHLVIKQPHTYAGYADCCIDYVRLVPLSQKMVDELEARYEGKTDKLVAAYFEPYSWAFNENVTETLQHRQPLTAYAEARVGLVDTQLGRFGMKSVYETRVTDQLLHSTIGDPINGVIPQTDNVGQMQQFSNTLAAEMRYARELGLALHANFGATNCYPDTPLQGDFSKQNPEWVRGHALKYELPEVRAYMLSMVREALELGAPGISIDFCRYPEGIDKSETCTTFLRELRKLADEFSKERKIPILVRFPAKGVRMWELFDYAAWAREGLVDYLCPSNIQGRHMHFDIAPYVKAAKGTKCKLVPVIDAIGWGPAWPGAYLWRVKQIYDAGADGVYIYQADDPILGRPADRGTARILRSSQAVRRYWENEDRERPKRSKGIYINHPEGSKDYHPYERLRVWLEGIPNGRVEMLLDGRLVNKYDAPPYVLGTEENESDNVISPGKHKLLVRAKDGDGWLEQEFEISGAQ